MKNKNLQFRKSLLVFAVITALTFFACNSDDRPTSSNTTFQFSNDWDGVDISTSDIENTVFTNANGENITITRLRYIISDITFTKPNGDTQVIEGYKLVDVTNGDLQYTINSQIETGTYSNVSFTYGLKDEDNITGIYTDLNAAVFNVPLAALGGGYHYMQFDGKYSNNTVSDAPFNYHHIRAVNPGMNPTFPNQPTFINVDLGPITITNNTTIEVKANIAEWFKNPNTWDLNVLNQVLMPNADAQLLMNQNGQNVFSLGTITD